MRIALPVLILFALTLVGHAADLASQCADRVAVEQVYYDHRTGTKPPFAETMPPAQVEAAVRMDVKKEALLKQQYGVAITPEMVVAEVRRIDSTTQAPEILADLKKALGGDPERFARSVARPIVVERTLHERYENDDALHATQRKLADQSRTNLLKLQPADRRAEAIQQATRPGVFEKVPWDLKIAGAAVKGGQRSEIVWEFAPRPAVSADSAASPGKVVAKSGAYSVEATAQVAKVLSSPDKPRDEDRKLYFGDLPADLQNVLRVQLLKAGDVSAVIELPAGFQVYVAKARTDRQLAVAVLTFPKRSYDEWIATQSLKE